MVTTTQTRNWSTYQQALFDEATTGRNLMLMAVAGSGKTTTIEEFCRRLDPTLAVKYLVFNKRNADEARGRMPANVDASTFHSSCNAALSRRLNRPKLDKSKCAKIFQEQVLLGYITEREADDFGPAVSSLITKAKGHGIGCLVPDEPGEWQHLIDHYGLDFDYDPAAYGEGFDVEARVIEMAQRVLRISNERLDIIDFDDMLYLVVKLHVALPRYDVVCVDEAQDTNNIQLAVLGMMVRSDGRIIAVGDPKQAIYGFRGANADAMEKIQVRFGCTLLPLSVNYRCSKAVIEAAKQYCPEIVAHDGAPDGKVEWADGMKLTDFQQTDAVLCRVTAPLITLAYRLLGRGVACTVLGRDIGAGLVTLINKMQGKRKKALTIQELEVKLGAYRDREVSRWTAKGEDEKAQSAEDKVESILAAIEALPESRRTLAELITHIEGLFSDDGSGRLTLATVHKSKGLEWESVYILDRDRMPSRWARQAWQREQEENLIYVAYTRAKVNLRFVALSDIVTK